MSSPGATKKRKKEEAPRQPSEQEKVEAWREEVFSQLLPSVDKDIIKQVVQNKQATPYKAKDMLTKGCSEELVAEILR